MAEEENNNQELTGAVDEMRDSVAAFTYDGDRSAHDHVSGAPEERELVLGDDDPRDAGLAEKPLTEDVAWTGRIFNVNRLQVELPDGRRALRDVVRHPGAVAVVALTAEGRICLVRQYRTALGRVTVEIPAGKLERGEDPAVAARRELSEETGASCETLTPLGEILASPGGFTEVLHLYMATGLTFGSQHPDEDEFISFERVPFDALLDRCLSGELRDGKTVAGVLKVYALRTRKKEEK